MSPKMTARPTGYWRRSTGKANRVFPRASDASSSPIVVACAISTASRFAVDFVGARPCQLATSRILVGVCQRIPVVALPRSPVIDTVPSCGPCQLNRLAIRRFREQADAGSNPRGSGLGGCRKSHVEQLLELADASPRFLDSLFCPMGLFFELTEGFLSGGVRRLPCC